MLSAFKSTAQLTTLGRAVASFEGDSRLRAPDHLAIRLLDPALAWVARSSLLRRLSIRLYDHLLPGAYLYTIARTKFIDSVLQKELEGGTSQVVILGAGLDSRPYRFHEPFPDVRFIEVDYPSTSARKLEKVVAAFGSLPGHVSYLPIDLNVDSLDTALSGAGHDPARRTLFIAEGLTMYLTAEAVDGMLACAARRGSPGSSITLDYVFRSILAGDTSLYGSEAAIRLVRKRGEPFTFGIPAGGMASFLAARGFECLADLGPCDIEKTYLTRDDGSLIGRSVGYWALAHAQRADG